MFGLANTQCSPPKFETTMLIDKLIEFHREAAADLAGLGLYDEAALALATVNALNLCTQWDDSWLVQ